MEQDIVPFDWYRIFIGDTPPLFILEVAFRTVFMYSFTIILARFMGKRGRSQLTPLEFIIVIVLGSATGDPMLYPNVPLLHGMTIITMIVLLERTLTWFTNRSNSLEEWIESTPDLIILKGELQKDAIEQSSFSEKEILMQLRQRGVQNIGDIEYAFLEPSGRLSIFKYKVAPIKRKTTLPIKEIKEELKKLRKRRKKKSN